MEAAVRGASHVVAVDFNLEGAEKTAEMVRSGGGKSSALYADCGKEVDMYAAITKVEEKVGPIGLFVANAGIGGGSPGIAASDKEWQLMGGVNTMQHVYWARHLIPRMVARGGGYVVVTSSAAGLLCVHLMISLCKILNNSQVGELPDVQGN